MFTGLITDVGEVRDLRGDGDLRIRIACGYPAESLALGASVACAGVCLTVVARGEEAGRPWFEVDASRETLERTTLGTWRPGTRVNLERALRVGDELGGHIVSGHVDGVARIAGIAPSGDSTEATFEVPADLARYIAPKGSVALDGTSLTVNAVTGARFTVNFIPHTKAHTTWATMQEGDPVNLEIDTLARYVARLREVEGL